MKKVIRRIVYAILIPLCLAGFFFHLDQSGFFNIDEIQIRIEGHPGKHPHLAPQSEVLKKRLGTFRGVSLWKIRMNGVSKEFKMEKWIKEYSLSREWPKRLVVKIVPQQVKALILSGATEILPVIGTGETLAPIDSRLAPDAVVFEGKAFQDEEFRKKAIQVLNEIPEKGSFSKSTISELRWNQKDGFMMTMMRNSIQVKMGEDAIALKSVRVGQVLEYLENRHMKAISLDANLSKKVLVRLENSTTSL